MIRIFVEVDRQGCLRRYTATGHAGAGGRGEDLTCAAVTALLRTAARLLYRQKDLGVRGAAPEAGQMEVKISGVPASCRMWLQGITDFLISGIRDVQEERPGEVMLEIESEAEGDR